MDYNSLSEFEVIRSVFHHNPANKNVKQIANYFNTSVSNIYKWGENPENSGASIPKQYIVPFCIYTKDYRLIEWYAWQIDRRTIPLEKGQGVNGILSDDLFTIDILRGQLAEKLKLALNDNLLDDYEKKALKDIVSKIFIQCHNFIEELNLENIKFS